MFEKHLDFSRKTSQGNREDSSFECFSSGDSVRLLVIETSSVVWRVISLYILLFCPGYTFEHPSLTDLTYPEIAVDQQLSTSLCHNRCSDIFEKKECRSVLSFAYFEAPYLRIQLPYRFASSKKLLPPVFRAYCSQKNLQKRLTETLCSQRYRNVKTVSSCFTF